MFSRTQIDSIRVLTLPDGRPVKCIEYDSFGNVTVDTKPDWQFPLGFACGLNDHCTGFVRFGFRDYDPRFGRFTAKDPIGDTGGDHDLWDYCIDDPVSMNDPGGLFPPLLLFGLGMLGAAGVGAGGVYGAAVATDYLGRKTRGKPTGAVDAVNKVAPKVGATVAAGAAPGALVFGGPAVSHGLTHAGQRVGSELASRGMAGVARNALQFADGYAVPMAAASTSLAGRTGFLLKSGFDSWSRERDK